MNSLRNRIAALLICAIVAVVALATMAADRALQPPAPETVMEPLARQIGVMVRMAEENQDAARGAGLRISDGPDSGSVDDGMARVMQTAFAAAGLPRTVVVTRHQPHPMPIVSVKLATQGWLVADLPDRGPPPDGWKILGMWIVLIVIGSAIVSVYAARKIVRPLELLQDAASRIGPDGRLPHIAETGSAEIRETARALNSLSDQLKAAMESRMRVVAAAGHDLRTPMTRMRLRAEFIVDDEERAKWLSDLEELDTIADSAIRLVREEVDRDPAEVLDLAALMAEIVGELKDIGHAEAIAFYSRGGRVPVRAAPVALKRALRNLALNAVTHGRSAEIRIDRDGDDVILTIADEGPGIPESLMDRVFEPFFRVDPARRKSIPGAGLGLAIAKEIIERFGGRLTVANRHPHGLLQTISFPSSGL